MKIEIVLNDHELKEILCSYLHKKYDWGNFPNSTSMRVIDGEEGKARILVELDTKKLEETSKAILAKTIKSVEED